MKSRVIKYGDKISTDSIIAGKYTKTLNIQELGAHAMEDLDPCFHEKAAGRCVIAAGIYFGCGSSREQAPVALKVSGIKCVLAKDFSRIFYRNAINLGLCVAECNTDLIDENDEIEYSVGDCLIHNLSKGIDIPVASMPDIMKDILAAGGVVPYIKNQEQGGGADGADIC